MKFFWIIAVVVTAAFTSVSVGPQKTSGQKLMVTRSLEPVSNRYIVVLDESTVSKNAVEPEVEAQAQYLSAVYGGRVQQIYSSALKGFVTEMTPDQAEVMNLDTSVRSIEEDGIISVSSSQPNAPWHLDRVDQRAMPIDTIYNYSFIGTAVNVYILDTGIRYTHVEFGGRADVVYDNINDGQNGNDCNGHGTHVAGIVGSATYGVAKNALLHSVRVLPCSGSGQISNLLAGVDWVTANHVSPAVANISITAPGSSPALEIGITNSIASGVTYAIAAGNNAADSCGFTPARTPNALTIGATANTDDRAGYSNYGTCNDLFAPGDQVTSLSNANDTATRVLSGTSMAAPMVAGAAALYLNGNPTASPAAVGNAIRNAATIGVVTNIDATSPNLLLFTLLTGSPTPTPTPTPTPGATVRVRKHLLNPTGTSSTLGFPYSATNLAASSFSLTDNTIYSDANVPVPTGQTVVLVTEAPVAGWQLTSIACAEGSAGVVNSTVDLANHNATIRAEPGEDITCTFTSQPLAPTAADVSISGRVTNASGLGISHVRLTIIGGNGTDLSAFTNSFGYYRFDGVESGRTYVISAFGKRYRFNSQIISLTDEIAGIDFTPL